MEKPTIVGSSYDLMDGDEDLYVETYFQDVFMRINTGTGEIFLKYEGDRSVINSFDITAMLTDVLINYVYEDYEDYKNRVYLKEALYRMALLGKNKQSILRYLFETFGELESAELRSDLIPFEHQQDAYLRISFWDSETREHTSIKLLKGLGHGAKSRISTSSVSVDIPDSLSDILFDLFKEFDYSPYEHFYED